MAKKKIVAAPVSGKTWVQKSKAVVKVIGAIALVVISSPLQLPKAIKGIAQYLALLAGVVDATKTKGDD